MQEIVLNLHVHSLRSDGAGSHRDTASAALKSGLDEVLVTDHNVLLPAMGGYYREGAHQVLMLVGKEMHDRNLDPQQNHLLVLGAQQEMAALAEEPEHLIHSIDDASGLFFMAHPIDPAAPAFGEADISGVNWTVENFTGIEAWNGLSELKSLVPTRLHGLLYARCRAPVARRSLAKTLSKWDELASLRRVVGVGGSTAHALPMRMGPWRRMVYLYAFHSSAINTHVLLTQTLTGEAAQAEKLIYAALETRRCFIGCDLPFLSRGFRFAAQSSESKATMGDKVSVRGGVTVQAHNPSFAEISLVRKGNVLQTAVHAEALTYLATHPVAYGVEVRRRYRGRRRRCIFSNPV